MRTQIRRTKAEMIGLYEEAERRIATGAAAGATFDILNISSSSYHYWKTKRQGGPKKSHKKKISRPMLVSIPEEPEATPGYPGITNIRGFIAFGSQDFLDRNIEKISRMLGMP